MRERADRQKRLSGGKAGWDGGRAGFAADFSQLCSAAELILTREQQVCVGGRQREKRAVGAKRQVASELGPRAKRERWVNGESVPGSQVRSHLENTR